MPVKITVFSKAAATIAIHFTFSYPILQDLKLYSSP